MNKVVIGAFFGDEGKGATVQWLCENSKKPTVIKTSGGPQCGHRVVYKGVEHICSSFGGGVLLGVPTYLDSNFYVDPICIKKEYDVLVSKGLTPKIQFNSKCRIITPYDVIANLKDNTILSHGSCGMGIYNTYKRYLEDGEKYYLNIKYPIEEVREYYKATENKALEEKFIDCYNWLFEFENMFEHSTDYIFELGQGLLLDKDCGFMPHCTPSSTGLNNFASEELEGGELYLVMRTYLTRHGNGYTPKKDENFLKYYKNLEEPTNLDTGIQGVFKVGYFDLDLLKRAIDRHCLDNKIKELGLSVNICINHLDCLKTTDFPYIHNDELRVIKSNCIKYLLKTELPIKVDNIYISKTPSKYVLV